MDALNLRNARRSCRSLLVIIKCMPHFMRVCASFCRRCSGSIASEPSTGRMARSRVYLPTSMHLSFIIKLCCQFTQLEFNGHFGPSILMPVIHAITSPRRSYFVRIVRVVAKIVPSSAHSSLRWLVVSYRTYLRISGVSNLNGIHKGFTGYQPCIVLPRLWPRPRRRQDRRTATNGPSEKVTNPRMKWQPQHSFLETQTVISKIRMTFQE